MNYLKNVLRLRENDAILVFNGRDGEFQARLAGEGKRRRCCRAADPPPGARARPRYLFAPLKHARLDYMVQKAAEMGVARSRRSHAPHAGRPGQPRAHARQCHRGSRAMRHPRRAACAGRASASARCSTLGRGDAASSSATRRRSGRPARRARRPAARPLALLIGPEGGFDEAERSTARRSRKSPESRSGRASCAPTRPRSPRSPWSRRPRRLARMTGRGHLIRRTSHCLVATLCLWPAPFCQERPHGPRRRRRDADRLARRARRLARGGLQAAGPLAHRHRAREVRLSTSTICAGPL